MSNNYQQSLLDPRWQRKRLEAMEASNFECENCQDSESTLNVHHGFYEKGKNPWEYPSDSLHCFCKKCHEDRHSQEMAIQRLLSTMSNEELMEVWGYLYLRLTGERHSEEAFHVDCLKQHYESLIEGDFDSQLSKKLDCVLYLWGK